MLPSPLHRPRDIQNSLSHKRMITVQYRIDATRRSREKDCGHLHHAMGLVLDQNRNMDLPSQRHLRANSLSNSCRGGLLFRHTNLQYLSPLPTPQQTYLPSGVPSKTKASASWRTRAHMAVVGNRCNSRWHTGWCHVGYERRERLLHGLNSCLGWSFHLTALVRDHQQTIQQQA